MGHWRNQQAAPRIFCRYPDRARAGSPSQQAVPHTMQRRTTDRIIMPQDAARPGDEPSEGWWAATLSSAHQRSHGWVRKMQAMNESRWGRNRLCNSSLQGILFLWAGRSLGGRAEWAKVAASRAAGKSNTLAEELQSLSEQTTLLAARLGGGRRSRRAIDNVFGCIARCRPEAHWLVHGQRGVS